MQRYTERELDVIRSQISELAKLSTKQLKPAFDDTPLARGIKLTAQIISSASEMEYSKRFVPAYYERPPALFYTDPSGELIYRIFGMSIDLTGKFLGQAMAIDTLYDNNGVLNVNYVSLPLEEFVPIKNWTAEQKKFLTYRKFTNPNEMLISMAFLSCEGFIKFLPDY